MSSSEPRLARSRILLPCVWMLLALLVFAGFFHLGADFPNHSRWVDDAAKFTDEGWYAAGALNHSLTGHWLRQGDFNPVVTIPVWSLILATIFHFTGISIVAARSIAFLFTLGTVLIGGELLARGHRHLAPIFMLLLLSSPILYAFSRIAILEPALLFFISAAALAAYSPPKTSSPRLILSGILFVIAMLTKSSAVFAGPAILYLIWFQNRSDQRQGRRHLIRSLAIPILTVITAYGFYWLLAVRTHPVDVRVLYGQNIPYLGIKSIPKAVRILYRSFTWIDPVLFPIAAVAVVMSFTRRFRTLWQDPLFGFAVIAYVGYSGFLLLHFDAGPRYFAVLVLPVMLVLLLFLNILQRNMPKAAKALAFIIFLTVAANIYQIIRMLHHPDYTLRDADLAIQRQIESDPSATRLVIGHGALESTFITHIPALDDLGETPVAQKLAIDHPGWLVTYSDNLDLTTRPGVPDSFVFTQTGKYPVLDNPSRQYLLLYRIQPK